MIIYNRHSNPKDTRSQSVGKVSNMDIKQFWAYYDRLVFKPMSPPDLEPLHSFQQNNLAYAEEGFQEVRAEYRFPSQPPAYQRIVKYSRLVQIYKKSLVIQQEANLLKHISISRKIDSLLKLSLSGEMREGLRQLQRQKFLRIPAYIDHELYLRMESQHLDHTLANLAIITSTVLSSQNRVQEYLVLLRNKLVSIQHHNRKAISRLEQHIIWEKTQQQIMCSLSPKAMICLNQTKFVAQNMTVSRDPDMLRLIVRRYALYQIRQLQEKQFLESIYFVRKFHKIKNDSFFKIQLEPNFYQKDLLISEEKILRLDKQRENSLFNAYNVAQKSYFTHISQNVYQFNEILRKRKSNKPPQKSSISKVMQQLRNEKKGYSLAEQHLDDFGVCHHCKHLFSKDSLATCRAKSKRRPASLIRQDPYLTSLPRPSSHVPDPLCHRSYCFSCLRNNYDMVPKGWKDFVCPFCQDMCFCTKCVRQDIILRFQGLYVEHGGDPSLHLGNAQTFLQNKAKTVFKTKPFKKNTRLKVTMKIQKASHLAKVTQDLRGLKSLQRKVREREALKYRLFRQRQALFRSRAKGRRGRKERMVMANPNEPMDHQV